MRDLAPAYRAAFPFPHAVVDDFIPDAALVRDAVRAIESVPEEGWIRREQHGAQVGKTWIEDTMWLPSPARELLLSFNEPEALQAMSALTGIPDLLPDPRFVGGGVHRVAPGGRLEIHSDFNFHPTLKLHRRVNALLYLNEGWDDAWGGHLELWERDMSACARKISPIFNRLAVFTITDQAFHGHPHPLACPPGRDRLSLALYYYTRTRPVSELSAAHWAQWQRRPG